MRKFPSLQSFKNHRADIAVTDRGRSVKIQASRWYQFQVSRLYHPGLFLVSWTLLRLLDFWSGFVDYSNLRLLIAIVLPMMILLPWGRSADKIMPFITAPFRRVAHLKQSKNLRLALLEAVLLILSFEGFFIFYDRFIHGANMGDTELFKQSIENTAQLRGVLDNIVEGGSHFKAHNSPFLLLFVPLVWIFGSSSWFIIQFTHSLAIVIWSYIAGFAIGEKLHFKAAIWPITILLFLATYPQHMTFYDTRFAALGILVFAIGLWKGDTRLVWIGFVTALLTRETAVLTVISMLLFSSKDERLGKIRRILIPLGLGWLVATAITMYALGGPVSAGRFDSCLKTPHFNQAYLSCVVDSVQGDWPLKLAYTVRLLSFGPTIAFSLVGLAGIAPEIVVTWLSRDNVLYNLSWHYYMQVLSIVLIFGVSRLQAFKRFDSITSLYFKWLLITCLWQFLTTVHPRLFT